MAEQHILLVTFPGQGHINPSLQFAKSLTKHGVKVTILTSSSATARMSHTLSPSFQPLIDVVSFSTTTDWSTGDVSKLMQELSDHGTKAVEDAVAAKRAQGTPYSRIVYNLLVPWAGRAARRLAVPVTLLWIQPAVLFGIYFHYHNRNFDPCSDEVIELPGLPRLRRRDLPSFFLETNPSVYNFVIPMLTENFEILDQEDHPAVVLNTFDELEADALRCLNKYRLLAIGPLIPSAFLDGRDPSDTSFGGDLIQKSEDYMQYLECAETGSVIYVAFGSFSELPRLQVEAIAEALMRSGRPFLWVIRGSDRTLSCREDLEKKGKIVAWCTQVEVLSHPSVGCFVTHCGWNSTLESLACGVPVVALPQWTDQCTNAKLVEDVWRSGVRAVKAGNGEIVEADEIQRCLEMVMDGGDASVEIRKQAKNWRDLAREAMAEGGTSQLNLKIFVDQIVGAPQ
ncbi:crocetin glucosyltransferase, chloroplastic-like [Salvia miltiorrhiza]|uniref:crocetin glucosyltransferase, chloroplastic-like n=1 Tax=Salvia miltiorrhiza TaxID=226208 RepID=UPI0025AD2032|nr:crocetin glucosyltransferase, chloroplastic-like [Salvia miltiorrhiza]